MANYTGNLVISVQLSICWRRWDCLVFQQFRPDNQDDLVADAKCVEQREMKHGGADRKFSDWRADPLVMSHNFEHRRI